ncbi:MAG: hypothetical protein ACYCSD_01100 [Acidiferrobacteraceae bacterium]
MIAHAMRGRDLPDLGHYDNGPVNPDGLDAMATQSEQWFEDYCTQVGIGYTRIPEERCKTPDYELTMDGQTVIVEVKELCPNPAEQESDRVCKRRGYGNILSTTPGDRVRKKITETSTQIKAGTRGVYPSILVLCDLKYGCGQIAGHLDPCQGRDVRIGADTHRGPAGSGAGSLCYRNELWTKAQNDPGP